MFVALFLQRQCLIEDEAEYVAPLLAGWHEFVFVGLEALHARSIVWSMSDDNDIRRGRYCVFLMHVHLVFVTKYRRNEDDC